MLSTRTHESQSENVLIGAKAQEVIHARGLITVTIISQASPRYNHKKSFPLLLSFLPYSYLIAFCVQCTCNWINRI